MTKNPTSHTHKDQQLASELEFMDRHFGNKHPEGLSTTRPPYFDGICYNFWKQRMRIFVSASDFEVWQIVEDGFTIPK